MSYKFAFLVGLTLGCSASFGQLPDPGNTVSDSYVPSAQFPVAGSARGHARSVETQISAEGNSVFYSYIGPDVPYEAAAAQALQRCSQHHAVCKIASIDQYSTTRVQKQTLHSSMFGQPFEVNVEGSQTRTRARAVVLGFDRALWNSQFVHCNDSIRVRFTANLGLAAVRQVPVGSLMDNGFNYGPPAPQPDASERVNVQKAYPHSKDTCMLRVRKDLKPGDVAPDIDWRLNLY